ncbi:MAG: pyridoxal phosphate-dependent aminotransferase [Erysipelotrichaceae bacterium]|nr:pyridoxal phosphate-dependent aminotransferase [Erysipelotrichaceae bacterium]
MKNKMINAFAKAEGGLFSKVEKADVGSSYQEMEKQGVALMGWADPFMPDKSMPKHVEEALINAIKDDSAPHYTAPIGNEELKYKIAQKLKEQNNLEVDPNRNILITPGSDSGLFFATLPFINDGDEVIIPSPSYPNNYLGVEIMGGKIVSLELKVENNYQFVKEDFEKLITDKTKAIVITHPNNPTTTVYNKKSLEILREVVIEHNLVLICDQAFEDFTYEIKMITPASMEGMFDRTVTVFSFSKGMGLSGLRVGYIVCSDVIMDSMFANAVGVIGATSTSAQKAIIAALDDTSFMKTFEEAFDYRRKQAYEILNSIPNVSCQMPESGFLCWVDVSKLGNSSEICDYLVKEARVSVNDGKNYGLGGEGHLRIVLGVYQDNQKVVDALNRIKEALIKFQIQ